jgi:hypothetical protein
VQRKFISKLMVACLAGTAAVAIGSAAWAAGGRNAEGKSPPTPRLENGMVDLGGNGIWNLPYITDFAKRVVGGGEIPYLPWSKAMWEYNKGNHVKYDPEGLCLPPGGPRAMGTPYPAQFLQEKDRIVVIFEGGGHVWREIHMDGRKHPQGDALNPTYFGDSIGHWDKDTLVVDTVGYNERSWIDYGGRMHTEAMHTVEKITRPEMNTLHYEATIDDPGAYSKPWTVAWDIPWGPNQELQEYICQENNHYMADLRDYFGQPFFRQTTKDPDHHQ